jgi:L-methionine (R)-S-oxide reductase
VSFNPTPFTTWDHLTKQAQALIEGEPDLIANLANLSALLKECLPDLNWAGFYLWNPRDQELVLGPFQGRPACIRIKPTRGVCGKAWTSRETQNVADVNAFPGHIACDSATESELVVPLLWKQECLGVLDLDSPLKHRFTLSDANELTELMSRLVPQLWKTKGEL